MSIEMKWPEELYLVRHAQTEYNVLKAKKAKSEMYQEFKALYESWKGWPHEAPSDELLRLAGEVNIKFSLGCSDAGTRLTNLGHRQAVQTGKMLAGNISKPDVIFTSPYLRTNQTYKDFADNCPELNGVELIQEDRIREQEHGLSTLYNDWRVFHVFNPHQKALFELEGRYDYCFPNGENVVRVRNRCRDWFEKLIRDYAGKKVWVFTHHLTILTILGLQQHWSREEFLKWDDENPPANSSITLFRGNPEVGTNGKLILDYYSKTYY